jgi:ligand-binding sensor domain-containing protein/two-component sensor histidine kinase
VKSAVVILSLLAPALFCLSQDQAFHFERYTSRDGLSHNQVSCIFKDSRNLIWVGTEFGLNLYDGNEFTPFFHIPGDTNSLPHNKILGITEDKLNRLWIGTQNGVSCFNLLTRKFVNFSRQKKGVYFLNGEFCHVYKTKDGLIWIGHGEGITSLDPLTFKSHFYPLQLSPPKQYRNRYVSHFLEDEHHNLWAATSLGVYLLKKGDATFRSFRFPENYPGEMELNACTKLAVDQQGRIYCGTWNAGIIYFDPVHQQFRQLDAGDIMKKNTVFDIYFDKKTTWVGTITQLYTLPENDLQKQTEFNWAKFQPVESASQSLPVFSIFPDNNSLWLATEKGLATLQTTGKAIANYSFENINNWSPISVVESGSAQLQICNGLALMSYDLDKKQATKKLNPYYPVQLTAAADGYWLTAQPGLYKLDKNLKVQEIVTHRNAGGELELFGSVYEDHNGKLWLGCGRKGLRTYDPKTKEWKSFFTDSETGFRQIISDQYGNIWLAHSLIRYNKTTDIFEKKLIRNPFFDSAEVNSVTSIFPTGKNIVWIGTHAGLYYYDYNNDSIYNIPLPSNISPRINGLVADKEDHLWLESNDKLVMYDIGKKTFKIFNEADGFIGDQISSKFTVLKNGNIVVGYNGGFAIIDPSKISASKPVIPPQFITINIDNNSLPDILVKPGLKHNQNISFAFVSPAYHDGGKNQYAYRLHPLDKDWKLIGNNSTQRFTNLPAGNYTFLVKAGNASGVWNEAASSFSFIVRPPFWKTWWFISLIILSLTAITYAIYRYRVNQLLLMERMRTRIATDLHDDIGATLSSISMYSDAVKEQVKEKLPHLQPVLEKMGENSRSMVGSMSDIVWAINPDNDEGEKLVERMETYAKDVCVIRNVKLNFNADQKMQRRILSLEQRKNIYLIFKEALNNALKYSDCRTISVSLTSTNHHIELKVADDGKGFNIQNGKKGNGLKNMELRAAEINSKLKITTSEGKGTSIGMISPIA